MWKQLAKWRAYTLWPNRQVSNQIVKQPNNQNKQTNGEILFTNYRIYSANTTARQLHTFWVVTKLAADAVNVEVHFWLWSQQRLSIEFNFLSVKKSDILHMHF